MVDRMRPLIIWQKISFQELELKLKIHEYFGLF
jgi:hypothetical protein